MKTIQELCIIVACLALTSVVLSQGRDSYLEIWVYNQLGDTITITDTCQYVHWDSSFYLTNEFSQGGFFVEEDYQWDGHNDQYGFEYNWTSESEYITGHTTELGYGLYKITGHFYSVTRSFYWDIRDTDILNPDMRLQFVYSDNEYKWQYKYVVGCDSFPDWYDVNDNDTLRLWELYSICEDNHLQ